MSAACNCLSALLLLQPSLSHLTVSWSGVCSETELSVIEHDILACRQVIGLHGVVFGVLQPDGRVAMQPMRRLLKSVGCCSALLFLICAVFTSKRMHDRQCGSLFVTFARAIDYAPDPIAVLHDLLQLQAEYPNLQCVLTSGQKNSLADGLDVIAVCVMWWWGLALARALCSFI